MYHEAVLLKESVDSLVTDVNGVYVDATLGGGGHTMEILKRLDKGKVVAFDQDEEALNQFKVQTLRQAQDMGSKFKERVMLVRSNFRYVKNFLQYHKMLPVDGVLVDLGVSSHQFDTGERGFSIRFDAPLDMRMNREQSLSAMQVINEYAEEELKRIFAEYGELHHARAIARRIVETRNTKKIETTQELMDLLKDKAERGAEQKFFAKLFQAIRIEVNRELEALKELLLQCNDIIRKDGRLVVISYHSLEDRLVKNFLATGTTEKEIERDVLYGHGRPSTFKALNKKPAEASLEEVEENPRARSAKMRVGIKV